MASKQEIVAEIRRQYGNMLNLREATEALGYSDKRAALRFLDGIPYCNMGKEKKFLAIDIGRRIHERMEDAS